MARNELLDLVDAARRGGGQRLRTVGKDIVHEPHRCRRPARTCRTHATKVPTHVGDDFDGSRSERAVGWRDCLAPAADHGDDEDCVVGPKSQRVRARIEKLLVMPAQLHMRDRGATGDALVRLAQRTASMTDAGRGGQRQARHHRRNYGPSHRHIGKCDRNNLAARARRGLSSVRVDNPDSRSRPCAAA